MNDTPKWQLWLLARLPRPLALMGIMLGNVGIRVFPGLTTVIAFGASTAAWAYIGLRYYFDVWAAFAIFGFALPAIVMWMYEEYRKLDRYTPRREKKTGDNDD